ncbi:MBL fold metallo-hydrolase [Pyrodictium occultum]|uniref:MBL fold metallo-hydrolase n=1 Tax=Pyrodictium occultum TaxID=2309 RepID=A0A0V8RTG4_PYROC|nr:MBL fold metallo-hydrolase [Pyrodictium occultum]KSW11359.1 MBL fold metallo-hydrolase [Pyrodictium occultum]
MGKPVIRVLGGGKEVGRMSILVRRNSGDKRGILLDAGVNFDDEDRPVFAATYPPKYIDAIILSHAHLDHIGTAPMYFISGNPRVYATRPTIQMAKLMLEDFLKLNGYYSPYEHREVQTLLEAAEYIRYGQRVDIDGVEASAYSAGHIPGSTFVVLDIDGVRIGFTGDINTIETKLMKPPQLDAIGRIDVLITEATYGASLHPPRERAEKRLLSIVEEVVDRGGTVLIPSFSIARGQEMMMILAEHDPGVPVYVDGMIRKVTEIFLENSEYINNLHLLRKAYEEFNIVKGWRDRNRAWRQPSVIIASAGMLKGGPSLYYLKRIGGNPRNAVVLVSFQAPGSNGRRIVEEGLMPGSEEPVRARVEWLDFSSHADYKGLLEVVKATKPRMVVIVHSEEDVAKEYAKHVMDTGIPEKIVIGENNSDIAVDA